MIFLISFSDYLLFLFVFLITEDGLNRMMTCRVFTMLFLGLVVLSAFQNCTFPAKMKNLILSYHFADTFPSLKMAAEVVTHAVDQPCACAQYCRIGMEKRLLRDLQ